MLNKEEYIQQLNIDTDEDVSSLIDTFESQISSYIGIPVKPIHMEYAKRNFNDNQIELTYYPIASMETIKITINEKNIQPEFIDAPAGIIYLKNTENGALKVEYQYGLTSTLYEMHIRSLITDMIHYNLDHGWTKNASSIKEGDVQVNYDTSVGAGALIQRKLDTLRGLFGVRCEMV